MDAATRITWLGHATVTLDVTGTQGPVRILTDPVLGARCGALSRLPDTPDVAAWVAPDAILLSHLHHDHADIPSLRRLHRVPIAASAENLGWVARNKLTPALTPRPDASNPWWTVAPGVQVRLVRADHVSRPMPHRPNAAAGFLIRTPAHVIWFAGDTSLYPELDRLPELAGAPIDVALVPIGGWGPRLSPGHLGPVEAAEAVALIGAAQVVPIHYGTLYPRGWPTARLTWLTAPAERLVEVLPQWSRAAVHPLAAGESLTV